MTDTTTTSPSTDPSGSGGPSKRLIFGGAALVLAIIAGVAIWYFVFRDTAPPKVDLERATESVEDRGSDATGSLDGTWDIDTSIGTFDPDADEYSSTFVGYRVREELADIGAKTAFGRTPDVSGSLTFDGTTISATEIEVDMTTLQSDDSGRDGTLQRQSIETDEFPTATYTLTDPIELDAVPTEGEEIRVDAVGELTLHGVTKEVTIALKASLKDDVIVVTGELPITFADYDIEKPTSFKVLSVEDNGSMELQLFFTKQQP